VIQVNTNPSFRKESIEFAENIIRGIVNTFDTKDFLPTIRNKIPLDNSKEYCTREELFERSLVCAAIVAKSNKSPLLDGKNYLENWLKGLTKFTDPRSSSFIENIPEKSPLGSQIAFALLLIPEYTWDILDTKQKQDVAQFIFSCAIRESYDNNHYFFHQLAHIFSKKRKNHILHNHYNQVTHRVLKWYKGNGWFIDGCNCSFDWYNAYGFHLYLQLFYYFDEDWRNQFGEELTKISREYLNTIPLFIDNDGYAIQFGRSLGYRFGNLAPFGWMILNHLEDDKLAEIKSMIHLSMKQFFTKSLDSENLIQEGYMNDNTTINEFYLKYGSQYFASHGLSYLLVDRDHDFWEIKDKYKEDEQYLSHGAYIIKDAKKSTYYNFTNSINLSGIHEHVKYYQHSYNSKRGLFLDSQDTFQNQTGISENGVEWIYRNNPRLIRYSEKKAITYWNITSEQEKLYTHLFILEDLEIYLIYHTSHAPLFLRFNGIAHEKDKPIELREIGSKRGTICLKPAGKNSISNKEGVYLEWTSNAVVEKEKPLCFALSKNKNSLDNINVKQTKDSIEISSHNKKFILEKK
jgi:hypothetical protein